MRRLVAAFVSVQWWSVVAGYTLGLAVAAWTTHDIVASCNTNASPAKPRTHVVT